MSGVIETAEQHDAVIYNNTNYSVSIRSQGGSMTLTDNSSTKVRVLRQTFVNRDIHYY